MCLIKDEASWSLMYNESNRFAYTEGNNLNYTANRTPRSETEVEECTRGKDGAREKVRYGDATSAQMTRRHACWWGRKILPDWDKRKDGLRKIGGEFREFK